MASPEAIQRYRMWYRKLLRLYPAPYYERFGESMEQTFGDLLHEEQPLSLFIETFIGIIKEHFLSLSMNSKYVLTALLCSTVFLIVPVTASQFVNGWLWTPIDYLFAWVLFSILALGIAYVISRKGTLTYKAALALPVFMSFGILWVTPSVRMIGEDNPANMLYFALIFFGLIGAIVTRLNARGMSRVMFAMAVVQMIIPVIGLLWEPADFSPGVSGVFLMNAFCAAVWTTSGILFTYSAKK
jgi:hypothetical protein